MFNNIHVYIERWKSSKNRKHDLDVLIDRARPAEPLYDRLLWLVDLIQWVRYQAVVKDHEEIQNVTVPAARIRFFLLILDRNLEWKARVAQTLRTIVRDVRAVDLFCEVGLPREGGFWTELKDRIFFKIMPERPLHNGITYLFNALFPEPDDVIWLSNIEPALFEKVLALFHFGEREHDAGWNALLHDIQGAMVILAAELEATGLSSQLRSRMQYRLIQDLPFSNLQYGIEKIIESHNVADQDGQKKAVLAFQGATQECEKYFDQVVSHLGQFGINQHVVYLLQAGRAKLRRLDDLVSFLMFEAMNPRSVLLFLIQLVEENQRRQSILDLFEKNTRLLARQIVDRSAEVGEHYITRDKEEYTKIFKKAAGGGLLTAFTVYIKYAMSWLGLPQFFEGVFFSLNYSASFVAIQFSGFTLATKQPAMTGPALAAKMDGIEDETALAKLIDEIVHLIRTQVVSIVGNVGLVVPTVLVFELVGYILLRRHLVSEEKAQYLVDSFSILGPTPIFAAFTGVLLWFSSLVAGWFDNWFVLNHMRDTLAYNRDLNFIFGTERCRLFADFIERNISGLSGNISLGFLLGLTPEILGFFGFHLDVRHVTLSSGSLAGAMAHFGWSIFSRLDFWLAVLGIGMIGFLNVVVSFTLAFLVALRSRNVQAPQRRLIYQAVWQRLRENPRQFLWL